MTSKNLAIELIKMIDLDWNVFSDWSIIDSLSIVLGNISKWEDEATAIKDWYDYLINNKQDND